MVQRGCIAIVLVFSPLASFVLAESVVNLTPASGADSIPASSAGGAFTSINGPVIAETNFGQIGPDESDLQINLPEGFEFDTAGKVTVSVVNTKLDESGSCAGAGNKTLRLGTSLSGALSVNITPEANSFMLHIKQASSGNCKGTLTFSGIKIRPTLGSTISGDVTYSGTASISGIERDAGSLGRLIILDDVEDDTEAPVITLVGANPIEHEINTQFIDPGASAIDNYDGEVEVFASGEVDVATAGEYEIVYEAVDTSGNKAEVIRIVNVFESPILPPSNGSEPGESVEIKIPSKSGSSLRSHRSPAITIAEYDFSEGGSVLGAADISCDARKLSLENLKLKKAEEVKKLQIFLNAELDFNIEVSGDFDYMTLAALSVLENKYKESISKETDALEFINSLICND